MWVLLLAAGVWFTLGSGAWQIRSLGRIFRETFGTLGKKDKSSGGITPFQAVSTALASTVGTGNIAGVATAIVAGGPGAIFWMWVSALLGMMTKYAEVFLAVKTRSRAKDGTWLGGPMYYMEKLGWKIPAVIFAVFGLCASLGVGNLTQVNTMAETLNAVFSIPPAVTGGVTVILAGIVLLGGIKSIARVTETLVPLMSVIYILLSAAVMIVCFDSVIPAFKLIITEAFSPGAAVGGAVGYTVTLAMRYGVGRGVFSNEAGLGSAPLAHAQADTDSPVRQGMWGAVEVFIDTIVLCTMTAVVILASGVWSPNPGITLDGAALTVAGFESALGRFGSVALSVCTVLFAFATILGWSFYGERLCIYLFKGKLAVKLFRCAYIFLLLPGAVMKVDTVWALADIFNGLMALPNLAALLMYSPVIFKGLKYDSSALKNK